MIHKYVYTDFPRPLAIFSGVRPLLSVAKMFASLLISIGIISIYPKM